MRSALDKGVRLEGGSGLMELWDFLQLKCASYINSDLPGLGQTHSQPPGKPLRFVQCRRIYPAVPAAHGVCASRYQVHGSRLPVTCKCRGLSWDSFLAATLLLAANRYSCSSALNFDRAL